MESARYLKTRNIKTNKYSVCLSILFFLCLFYQISSHTAFSQTGTLALFEAKEYVKPKGAPVTYTDTLQVTPGDYILWVYNGPGSGFGGFGEVKNVSVSINDIEIVNSSDLRTNNPVTKTISLQSNNTVKVVLKGQGGNSILLGISPPPVTVAITSPADGAVFNSSPVTVEGTVSSNTNVTVNGIQANVSNNTFSASIPLIEGANTITVIASDQYSTTYRSINVTLITKGEIAGTVADSSTGLPLPSATVSVTDSLSIIHTAITDSNPKTNYTITSIASGDFTGSILKDGYTSYSFTGTMSPGRTVYISAALSPALPTISNIAINNITRDSATITWTTDQPTSTIFEYGTTTSYGSSINDASLTTSHSILLTNLTQGTIYHFRVTSKNSYGFASTSEDNTFTTQSLPSPITLTITSPQNGDTINKTETMVTGTMTNSTNSETGITVNGILANVHGNEFVANHVPLTEGANTLTVKATDAAGNTNTTSITVNAGTTVSYIKLTSNIESGISPLTVYFSNETSNLPPASYQIDFEGDGVIDYAGTTFENISHTYTSEGIFYPIITVTDNLGNAYSDTAAITVFSKTEMDNLLKGKWDGMKGALASGDVETAVSYFAEKTKERYRTVFTAIQDKVSSIAANMQGIQLIYLKNNMAKYRIKRSETMGEITYYIYFELDENGIWRIRQF